MAEEEEMQNLFGSDDEDEEENAKNVAVQDADQMDLEDDMGDEQDDDDEGGKPTGSAKPASRFTTNNDTEDEDEEEQQQDRYRKPERPVAPPMAIEAPLLPLPPAEKLHLLRSSNIVGFEPAPFDPATFQLEHETYVDEATNSTRGAPNAKMRWRTRRLADGREVTESNARFVRWSDGSLQLLLGSEVLDVNQQDISKNNLYLFAVRSILQGQAQLTSRLALRPASLDSGLHRRLRDSVDKRHGRGIKVGKHGGMTNPEADKAKREAVVEERNKSREQLQKKQDRLMVKYNTGAARAPRNARLSENYLEEEQDWEGNDGAADYGGSQHRRRGLDPEEEAEASRRLAKAKRPSQQQGPPKKRHRAEEEEEEEEEEEDEYDDDEEEYLSSGEEMGGGRGAERGAPRRGGASQASAGKSRGSQGDERRSSAAAAAAAPAAKSRRGVVISDEEDN